MIITKRKEKARKIYGGGRDHQPPSNSMPTVPLA